MFYRELIDENCGDQKRLFSVTKRLLPCDRETRCPPFKDKAALANKFGELFAQKIVTIQGKLDELSVDVSPCNTDSQPEVSSIEPMTSFTLLTEHEVRKLIEATPKKSCVLDPMPTPLLVACTDTLLPVLTKIINLSLQNRIFADQWKCALVHPLLKKLGLEPIFQNFRPVSNLQYISKLRNVRRSSEIMQGKHPTHFRCQKNLHKRKSHCAKSCFIQESSRQKTATGRMESMDHRRKNFC